MQREGATTEPGRDRLVLDHAIFWIQKSQLSSNQEEADTKVFLTTQFSENVGCSDITIFTVDSDIATLATSYVKRFSFDVS